MINSNSILNKCSPEVQKAVIWLENEINFGKIFLENKLFEIEKLNAINFFENVWNESEE